MLGRSAETPRPRPPGRTRLSTTNLNIKTASPPPAYAPSFAFPTEESRIILGSPLAATFQRFNWDSIDNTDPAENDHEWMNERSQEELTELLAKAGGLIKERENELSLTSAVCRDLYENNVALKSKHKALLARLPSTQESSPDFLASPAKLDGTEDRLDPEEVDDFYTPTRPMIRRRHTRRISMSTNDISMLADQNAELLQKLEKLEFDSNRADQAGRRELRRLEKEISYLKDELEKSQARDEELGKKAEKAVEEAWKKRKERDSEFKAIRNLGRDFHGEGSYEVKNFAPEGSRFGGPSEFFSYFPTSQDSPSTIANLPSQDLSSPSEKEVISQLLAKMKELETTNTQILEQQTRTADELQAVHKETEQINKVYEYLSDPEQVQLELEIPQKELKGLPSRDHANNTTRFHSFRRRLEDELDASSLSLRQEDILRRDSRTPSRSRKSVMGLFDSFNSETDLSLEDITDVTIDKHSSPFTVNRWKHLKHGSVTSALGTNEATSPALSTLDLFSPSRLDASRPTLESELGAEYTDSWGAHAGNFHLRTTSLTDISQFAAISPSPAHLPRMSALGLMQRAGKDDHSQHGVSRGDTKVSVESVNVIFLSSESPAPKSPRYQRITETIRSRTGRWANSRFKDTLSDKTRPDQIYDNQHTTTDFHAVIPEPLADALNGMVENMTNAISGKSSPTETVDSPESSPTGDKTVQLRSELQPPEKKRHGIGAIILEIWLWLQFVIIIVVFVWAMAKRGPKSVLRDAAERRALSKRT
ncbi:hypothetical protein BDQ17DRAFT_1540481 [Cyathus striatus]|nr:hypothetical protein BDQ17DRAFT_1540481 [Cyathus striatus]